MGVFVKCVFFIKLYQLRNRGCLFLIVAARTLSQSFFCGLLTILPKY
jgi:hypothetical protein